jgi:hypothetical protein
VYVKAYADKGIARQRLACGIAHNGLVIHFLLRACQHKTAGKKQREKELFKWFDFFHIHWFCLMFFFDV